MKEVRAEDIILSVFFSDILGPKIKVFVLYLLILDKKCNALTEKKVGEVINVFSKFVRKEFRLLQ